MKAEDKVKAVNAWQSSPFHPLTCGIDSRHPNLEAAIINGTAELYCPQWGCKYRQKNIPDTVFKWFKSNREAP